ncbi:hypothetical protein D7I46_03540 [Lactococcus allomyrinae]|uniref:HTH-type transcriptional regulator Rgg C-terminal domain-containing protein n=2 Tax=Lactococcus allomyrinae TaxID=2419773 RepID=A0A387BH91_9LACT|nr:hypothetical protein D7I46_03540 [Lactococcus allomyrinae]
MFLLYNDLKAKSIFFRVKFRRYESEKMNDNLGKAYKSLRLMRNIEAKSIACENLSYSQLMKFEAGKTTLTIDKLMVALNGIGTTLMDFEYAYHELEENKNSTSWQIWQSFWQRNIAKLEILIEQQNQELLKNPDDTAVFLYKMQAEAFLKQLNPRYHVSQTDVDHLVSHLLNISQWWYVECEILMNCAVLFSDKQLADLTNQMISPKVQVRNWEILQGKIDAALLSVIRIFIANKHFGPLREIFNYLEAHVLPDYNMYERAMFAYFKALYKFRKQSNSEHLADVERCIDAFKVLECFGLANLAAEELERYKKESHI